MKYALRKSLFSLLFGCLFLVPSLTFAAEIKGLGTYVLPEDGQVNGNVYIAAGDINIKGHVNGDLVGVGGSMINTGTVSGDTTLLGGNVYASSTMRGDDRIIAGTVKVGGIVNGDVVVAGGSVEILPNTIITGDVIVLGGQVVINNTITGKLKVIAGDVVINGTLEGTSDITSPNVVFGGQSKVTGKINYFSHKPARIEAGAQGQENVYFNQIQWIQDSSPIKRFTSSFVNFWLLLKFVNTLLLCFILLFVFKPFSQQVVKQGINRFVKNIFVGLLMLVFIPVLSVVFIASLFALPIGMILILLFAVIYIISSAYSAMIMGALINHYLLRKDIEITFPLAVVGACVLALLHFIPFVGSFIRAIFFLATIGVTYRQLYAMIKS